MKMTKKLMALSHQRKKMCLLSGNIQDNVLSVHKAD